MCPSLVLTDRLTEGDHVGREAARAHSGRPSLRSASKIRWRTFASKKRMDSFTRETVMFGLLAINFARASLA